MLSVRTAHSLALGVLVVAACSDETTRYASPDSFATKTAHEPDGGYPAPPPDAGPERTCSTPPDAQCAVTWTKDVYPSIVSPSCGRDGCHAPGNYSPIVSSDVRATRLAFTNFVLLADRDKTPPRYYVEPCSRDPTASRITCNLAATNACEPHMPVGEQLDDAKLKTIATWLACGAPL